MMSFIRGRITYANAAITAALVFAMAGGAFAAAGHGGHHASKKHKYVVASVSQIAPPVRHALKGARGPAGEAGPRGATGATGAAGEKGAQGVAGEKGVQGVAGETGAQGAAGETPKMKEFSGALGSCTEGGTEFSVSAKQSFACTGKEGKEGKEGQPWTPNNALPSGATETGAWSSHPTAAGEAANYVALSFFIPLAKKLPSTSALYITAEENAKAERALKEGKPNPLPAECPGVASAPKAKPGFLCVYAAQETFVIGPAPEKLTIVGADENEGIATAGAIIKYEVSEVKGYQRMFGTFAVTGE